jgi:hypothetical protein
MAKRFLKGGGASFEVTLFVLRFLLMSKLIAILGLAVISVLSPAAGQAQQSTSAESTFHSSHFIIEPLSNHEDNSFTYVDGEITNNVKTEPVTVLLSVEWYDKNGKVIAESTTRVDNLAPGEARPFQASTSKNPEIKSYGISVKNVY